jgi:hypothetical protein
MEFLLNQEFRDNVRQHFVCITGTYMHLDGTGKRLGEDKKFAFSGFVIEIYGVWCLVTAGHVIHLMDALRSRSDTKLLRCSLVDYFNPIAKVREPTPFPFADLHHIDMDKDGVDVGLIPLPDFFRDSLRSNGIIPLPVGAWMGSQPPKCDEYALLGIPEHDIIQIEATAARGPGLRAKLSLVGLDPQPVPPDKIVSPVPRFCANLLDGGELRSVKGMSGGPIVGIRKKEGGAEYACIAIQGSWDPEARQVFGTPMAIIVAAVKSELDQQIKKITPLTKLDVVRRQLEAAVELFFLNQDPVAIHTLAASASTVLKNIAEQGTARPMFVDPRFLDAPAEYIAAQIREYQAHFDDADRDPNAVIKYNPIITEILLSIACGSYIALTGEPSKLFLCMIAWSRCREERIIADEPAGMQNLLDDICVAFKADDRAAFFTRFMAAKRDNSHRTGQD